MKHSNGMYGDETPIAAFATTPGDSALTLIRCSGKNSLELSSSFFVKNPSAVHQPQTGFKNVSGNTVIHGWIATHNEIIDEVLVSVFRSPKSYTGEDSFDICCHGGQTAGKAVMAVLKKAGFRDALPGEFTFRAFLNGKLDLTRCESVMELVSAKTDTSRRHAVSRLSGALHKEIDEIKQLLVQVLAAAEIYLDYSEDEVSADDEEKAGILPNRDIAITALTRLKKLSDSWQIERIYQEGLTVVIAGPPNSGKSSLFNAMLKEDRSIVTEIPGTTRDWIEAWISVEGIPIRLIDTAGLRDTNDSAEKIGVERSRKLLKEACLVLYLIDGTAQEIPQQERFLYVWNKADINPMPAPLADKINVSVSAKTGEGLDKLYTAITGAVVHTVGVEGVSQAALGTSRQKNLVDTACAALEEALVLTEQRPDGNSPLDIVAPLLREAVNALGEITGEVSTADILEEMFSRFCVGK